MTEPVEKSSPHIADYYILLLKHKWLILLVTGITVLVSMLYTLRMQPVYRASSVLVIDKEQTKSPLTGERLEYESYISQSLTFNTHFKLITSRPVIEKVIADMGLDQEPGPVEAAPPNVIKGFLSTIRENARLLLGRDKRAQIPGDRINQLVKIIKSKIDIQQISETRLLMVSIEDKDPFFAAKLANSLAASYIDFNYENRIKSSRSSISLMTGQAYSMKERLEEAEEEFQKFKQDEKLFSIVGKQKIISQKIADFNDIYLKARNQRLEMEAKLEELNRALKRQGDFLELRSMVGSPLINDLYARLLIYEVELEKLREVYKIKHPKIVEATSNVENTRQKLVNEIQREIDSLQSQASVLAKREQVAQQTVAAFEQDAIETNEKELQYRILERNMDTNQKLYNTLLAKSKESGIIGDVDVSSIRLVERAAAPINAVRPRKKLNLAVSVVLGFVLGVCLAFILEYADRTIRSEEDIQRVLDLPVLAVVPVGNPERTFGTEPEAPKGVP